MGRLSFEAMDEKYLKLLFTFRRTAALEASRVEYFFAIILSSLTDPYLVTGSALNLTLVVCVSFMLMFIQHLKAFRAAYVSIMRRKRAKIVCK